MSSTASTQVTALIDELCENHRLSLDEYEALIDQRTPEAAALLAKRADAVRRNI